MVVYCGNRVSKKVLTNLPQGPVWAKYQLFPKVASNLSNRHIADLHGLALQLLLS
jgi:hypothetical protein